MKIKLFLQVLVLLCIPAFLFSESFYSPTWGFKLDLPEGYDYIDGDGKDRFSFCGPDGIMFDLIVYNGNYANMNELVNDVNLRLGNTGDVDFFTYNNKQAAIIELIFGGNTGWGLCVELARGSSSVNSVPPMLLALSYGQADNDSMSLFHLSALDSIAPSQAEYFYPGPIMEYSYPRGEQKRIALNKVPAGSGSITAVVHENDAEAAQVLVEREFNILTRYLNTPFLNQAWLRYYRFIYRDSYTRISDAASVLARQFGGNSVNTSEARRSYAQRALAFVQGFDYERNRAGSDFTNLVTAVTEGRGDCDSRAMLWAVILDKANIRAAMMVSSRYSHAMGLADIAGSGARFESYGTNWLVAETTANIDIGLIAQDQSDPAHWLGIIFD